MVTKAAALTASKLLLRTWARQVSSGMIGWAVPTSSGSADAAGEAGAAVIDAVGSTICMLLPSRLLFSVLGWMTMDVSARSKDAAAAAGAGGGAEDKMMGEVDKEDGTAEA
jgi:hypothetical protein